MNTMGQMSQSKTATPTRRFVLADKFKPRAQHKVELTESPMFAAKPNTRVAAKAEEAGSDVSLQSSIQAALAEFK